MQAESESAQEGETIVPRCERAEAEVVLVLVLGGGGGASVNTVAEEKNTFSSLAQSTGGLERCLPGLRALTRPPPSA